MSHQNKLLTMLPASCQSLSRESAAILIAILIVAIESINHQLHHHHHHHHHHFNQHWAGHEIDHNFASTPAPNSGATSYCSADGCADAGVNGRTVVMVWVDDWPATWMNRHLVGHVDSAVKSDFSLGLVKQVKSTIE
jgi:hypothetical protein